MNCKSLIFLILFLTSCSEVTKNNSIKNQFSKKGFLNKGFTLVYNSELYKNKTINNKIETRSLIIFQKNLKKNTSVKITNLINSKYILAKVGKNTNYPIFYNSVISERIASELEIDLSQPYVEIKQIIDSNIFAAKKAITYDEEKNVASKAPIDDIKIKDLTNTTEEDKELIKTDFVYIVKIGDFYFNESAIEMMKKIKEETIINNVSIKKISSNNFRVFIGPYHDLNSLKKSFNAIDVLQFENIEIIKN